MTYRFLDSDCWKPFLLNAISQIFAVFFYLDLYARGKTSSQETSHQHVSCFWKGWRRPCAASSGKKWEARPTKEYWKRGSTQVVRWLESPPALFGLIAEREEWAPTKTKEYSILSSACLLIAVKLYYIIILGWIVYNS